MPLYIYDYEKKKEKEKHFRSKFTKNENLVIIYAR